MTVERWLRVGGLTIIALGFLTLFTDELEAGGMLAYAQPYARLFLVGVLLIVMGITITISSALKRFNPTFAPP